MEKGEKTTENEKKAVCGGEDYNHSLLFNIVPFWCTNFSFSVRSLVLLACRLCCISFGEFHQITRNYWNCPRSLAHLQKRTNMWFFKNKIAKTKLLKVFSLSDKNNRCFAMVSGDRKTTRMICTSFLFPFWNESTQPASLIWFIYIWKLSKASPMQLVSHFIYWKASYVFFLLSIEGFCKFRFYCICIFENV